MIRPKPPSFTSILLLHSFLLHHSTNAAPSSSSDPLCSFSESQDFACPSPYECRVGRKNFDGLFPSAAPPFACDPDRYCDCDEASVPPNGFGDTGCRCESEFRVCGDGLVCLHGAPCVSVGGKKGEGEDSVGEFICGCAYAPGGNTWVGEHCEYGPEALCGDSGYDNGYKGEWFCTDNGTCRVNETDPLKKCECDEGYYGLHCELAEEHACETTCLNDGVCTRGVKKVDHVYYTDDRHEGPAEKDVVDVDTKSHCVCPYPYTGDTCAEEEEEGEGDDDRCGGCGNGARCRFNTNTGKYYCDCGTADVEDEGGNVVSYAGKRCEFLYSSMCPAPNGYDAKEYFCTNGGQCPKVFHEPCTCKAPHSGPRCEFTTVTDPSTPTTPPCPLPCENSGTCFFGSSPSVPYAELDLANPKNSEMHCKCPAGEFTGFLCETPVEHCEGGMHACANGGRCVES